MPTTYLIAYRSNDLNRADVIVYPERAAAAAAADARGAVAANYVMETEADVPPSGVALVTLHNAVAETGFVKKFESRAAGVKRLFTVLARVAQPPRDAALTEVTMTETKKGRKAVAESHKSKAKVTKPRAGTMRSAVLLAMVGKSFQTPAAIAAAAGIPEDRVVPHIYATYRDCGYGYEVSEDGEKYRLDLPEGTTKSNILAEPKAPPAPKEKKAKGGGKGKGQTNGTAAEAGEGAPA